MTRDRRVSGPERLAQGIADGKIETVVFDLDGTLYPSSAGIEGQLRPLMARHAARVLGVPIGPTPVYWTHGRTLNATSNRHALCLCQSRQTLV
jgi:streptogramin lyase